MQQETVQKAKDHTEKVFQIVHDLKLRESEVQKIKESEIENKLKQADEIRNQVNLKKIEKAQISQIKRSSSNIQA